MAEVLDKTEYVVYRCSECKHKAILLAGKDFSGNQCMICFRGRYYPSAEVANEESVQTLTPGPLQVIGNNTANKPKRSSKNMAGTKAKYATVEMLDAGFANIMAAIKASQNAPNVVTANEDTKSVTVKAAKPTVDIKAEIKNGRLILSVPVINEKSKSGKSTLIASSHGNQEIKLDGKSVRIGLNVYTK